MTKAVNKDVVAPIIGKKEEDANATPSKDLIGKKEEDANVTQSKDLKRGCEIFMEFGNRSEIFMEWLQSVSGKDLAEAEEYTKLAEKYINEHPDGAGLTEAEKEIFNIKY